MLLKKWEDLPSYMKCDEVRTYYDILSKRKISLVLKRFFDVVVASIMLIILAIPMAVIAVMIKFDSHGPVFYRQERVTTMVNTSEFISFVQWLVMQTKWVLLLLLKTTVG